MTSQRGAVMNRGAILSRGREVRAVQKGWKHLFSVPEKNRSRVLPNIVETSCLFHGNFFDISLNIVSSVILQSEIIKQST